MQPWPYLIGSSGCVVPAAFPLIGKLRFCRSWLGWWINSLVRNANMDIDQLLPTFGSRRCPVRHFLTRLFAWNFSLWFAWNCCLPVRGLRHLVELCLFHLEQLLLFSLFLQDLGCIFFLASRYWLAHLIRYLTWQCHNLFIFSRSSSIIKSLTQLETSVIFLNLTLILEFVIFTLVDYHEFSDRFDVFDRCCWLCLGNFLSLWAILRFLTRLDGGSLLQGLKSSPLVVRAKTHFLLSVDVSDFICCSRQQSLAHRNPLLLCIQKVFEDARIVDLARVTL